MEGVISLRGARFKGTRGLFELLIRKNVNSDVITKSNLNAYKSILVWTNAYLVGYETGGDIQVSLRVKYAKVISKLFPSARRPRRSALRQYWASFRGSHAQIQDGCHPLRVLASSTRYRTILRASHAPLHDGRH